MTRTMEPMNRDQLLDLTADLIQGLHEKVTKGRFKDLDVERAKDSKLRILVTAIGVYDTLLKNKDVTPEPEGKAAIDELMDYLRNTPDDPIQVIE